MNILTPLDYQNFSSASEGQGTVEARAENNNRVAIEAPQGLSQSKHTSQDSQSDTKHDNAPAHSQDKSKDKVSISAQGKKAAEDEANEELSDDEKSEVQTLKDRDREVRIHEQAHAAVGGQYAGSPSYEFETGPDGNRYAVSGEVSIDVSEEQEPQDTVEKMQVVRAAALAPAEPSTQDLKVAAEATQKENQARAEVSKESINSEGPKGASPNLKTRAYQEASIDAPSTQISVSA